MYVVQVTLTVANQYISAFEALLIENAKVTRKELGCVCFEVSVDYCDGVSVYLLYEKYRLAQDFEFHLTSEHFKTFSGKTEHMITEKVVRTFELLPIDIGI